MSEIKTTKKCNGECGLVKPLTDFYAHKSSPDGHAYKCKKCDYLYQKKIKLAKKDKLELERKQSLANQSLQKLDKSGNKSPALIKAEAIYKRLSMLNFFKQSVRKTTAIDAIFEVLDTIVNQKFDTKFDTKEVLSYNKGELRKDLIKMIKNNNTSAANTLIDLDNMNSKSEEIIIVPITFGGDTEVTAEALLTKYLEGRDEDG